MVNRFLHMIVREIYLDYFYLSVYEKKRDNFVKLSLNNLIIIFQPHSSLAAVLTQIHPMVMCMIQRQQWTLSPNILVYILMDVTSVTVKFTHNNL